MLLQTAVVLCAAAGLAAARQVRRLPARAWAAFVICALPPLGLYYLIGSC